MDQRYAMDFVFVVDSWSFRVMKACAASLPTCDFTQMRESRDLETWASSNDMAKVIPSNATRVWLLCSFYS